MLFSRPVAEIIRIRKSWRSFDGREVEPQSLARLDDFISGLEPPVFGGQVRVCVIKAKPPGRNTVPGTYGSIKGACDFLVGALGSSKWAMVDFGYQFEKVVLFATDLGLGTCWIGGIFSRTSYAAKAGVTDGMIVPAISPVGYCAEKRTVVDTLTRTLAGSKHRKPWAVMFFQHEFGAPLSERDAGRYAEPLEMVRLGPSASNRQPWRVIMDGRGFHFYLERFPGYLALWGGMDLQKTDLGIAMCHFELTAREAGLSGVWQMLERPPAPSRDGIIYIASWVTD